MRIVGSRPSPSPMRRISIPSPFHITPVHDKPICHWGQRLCRLGPCGFTYRQNIEFLEREMRIKSVMASTRNEWEMNRRRFLKGLGACVALPAFESVLGGKLLAA